MRAAKIQNCERFSKPPGYKLNKNFVIVIFVSTFGLPLS
jgi:hypothetical protein